MLDAVPAEVKACPQWIAWRREWNAERAKWDKIPVSCHTGHNCDVAAATSWSTFEHARHIAATVPNHGAGFVLGYGSGVVGADFDDVLDSNGNVAHIDRFEAARRLQSYMELSPSGTGVHVLLGGTFPRGVKIPGVELYGAGRFFTMTGKVHPEFTTIQPRQYAIDQLAAYIESQRKSGGNTFLNWAAPEIHTDAEVYYAALQSSNGERFGNLWQGMWNTYYASQSEADLTLVNYLYFHSQCPPQTRRLFLMSGLGQRAKARRDDYVGKLIQKSADKSPPLVAIPPMPAVQHVATAQPEYVDVPLVDNTAAHDAYLAADDIFKMPHGLAGDVANYVLAQSMWAMQELATITALGLMAGICGRQYQLRGSGLNLYMMFLAITAEGKDAMSTGLDRIFHGITAQQMPHAHAPGSAPIAFPAAAGFKTNLEMTGKGLARELATSTTLSTVSVWTEFSRYMSRMASPNANEGVEAFQKSLLTLYTSGARGKMFGGIKNADKAADIATIESPAFTLIAEGTPEKFYASLNEAMISEGLLSRFIIVERMTDATYNPGYTQFTKPPQELVDSVASMCRHVLELRTNGDLRLEVEYQPDADQYQHNLLHEWRARGGRAQGEVVTSLWRRGHAHITRIAALLAISVDRFHPLITVEQLIWAQRIVERQIASLVHKFRSGHTGEQDVASEGQYECLMAIIAKWQESSIETLQHHPEFAEARSVGLLPYKYIMQRAYNYAAFRHAKPNRIVAFRNTLQQLIDDGTLRPANLDGRAGKFYQVK